MYPGSIFFCRLVEIKALWMKIFNIRKNKTRSKGVLSGIVKDFLNSASLWVSVH